MINIDNKQSVNSTKDDERVGKGESEESWGTNGTKRDECASDAEGV